MTQSEYADNIESAIEIITKTLIQKDKYEIDVTDFHKKAVEMFSRNRTISINAKISLNQKLIYKKANNKIRKIIQQSEKELLRIQNKKKIEAIKSICEKYQVKENTITRLL
jgi:hypothetical protein